MQVGFSSVTDYITYTWVKDDEMNSSEEATQEEDPEFWRSQARSLYSMGITTYTAARILKGQLQNQTGEETVMTMDTFPNVGLAKTQRGNEVTSILKWAKDAGKSVGIVTTTRVQHATPATSYAHSASRKWYSDADMPEAAKKDGCTDIASQLLKNTDIDEVHDPEGHQGPEYPADFSSRGKRKDGRNLIDEWQKMKIGKVARYVWNQTDFSAVDPETTDYLMALFEPGDLRFEVERDPKMDPGAYRPGSSRRTGSMALHEAVALDYAIAKGLELTNEEETPLCGKSPLWAQDMLPYTTLMYGTDPDTNSPTANVQTSVKWTPMAAVPTESATHSGEDVAVLARGPMAHLFQGVQEQNYIAHAMAYAACVGADLRHCQAQTEAPALQTTFTQAGTQQGGFRASPCSAASSVH
ncbi:hypothetical protein F7725_021155 [Dissostichus mawsoni]|uniref:alkaline phosphatase n=1 Tax=Dissostichus mawsoni TaxID=36200 RepID=A0A7J5YHZ5_DISMA|nr:hypothetical protein F7725_021155 [Dissostichus mawsoni]